MVTSAGTGTAAGTDISTGTIAATAAAGRGGGGGKTREGEDYILKPGWYINFHEQN